MNAEFKNATFTEVLNPNNYSLTVTRKETRTGKVSFAHVVTFKGEVFDTRTSAREYRAYVLNIEVGQLVASLRAGAEYQRKSAARYRADAANGGVDYHSGRHTPEQFTAWAESAEENAASYAEQADTLEAKGPEFNWSLKDQGTGYTTNPAKARGVVVRA